MYDKDKIKNSLTIEQIFDLLVDLGGEPIQKENYIISKTICHNAPREGSYKLYYYDNTKLFKCYTECNDTFDVFQLICKIKKWELYQAILFVAHYFGILAEDSNFFELQTNTQDWEILNKYEQNNLTKEKQIVDLKVHNNNILKNLPHPIIKSWEEEGIKRNIIQERGIAYNPVSQSVIIPYYDINNKLIGIRERTLVQENESNGKYKPATLNGTMYNHPLSFSLYNINNSKENIKIMRKAIIFESEKATLQYASYFGEDKDISVAVCGSSLIWYQVQLLLSLGVEEIVIAFDKQFKEIGDIEFKQWTKKLVDIYNKYSNYVNVTFIFDKWNLLGYKDAPTDRGKDIFIELCNRRFSL